MKRKRVGTITLALGLITLGVLLFINNFTNIAVNELCKYWPVLLMGLGIETIIYAILYSHKENVKLSVDVFSIIFIIGITILCNNWHGGSIIPKFTFNFNGNNIVDGIFYKNSYKTTIIKDNISKDADINKLLITNGFGDIKLVSYEQKCIKLEANICVKYNDEQAAKDYAGSLLKVTEGAQTKIALSDYNNANKSKYSMAEADFIVYVPADVYVEAIDSYGDISVAGMEKDLTITNEFGDVNVEGIRGSVNITSSFGDIKIDNVGQKLNINNQYGKIVASNIKGDAEIKNSYGDIEYKSSNIENADIYAKTSYGDINTNLRINITKSISDYIAQCKNGDGKYRIQLVTNNGDIDIK